ncbi:MAG TPA: hypothetical protein VK808_13750 [Bacteroidia bacterium]|nr:hypothetical protein [Bacteroidia bacterium]
MIGFLFLVVAISLQISSYEIIKHISSRVVDDVNFADSLGDISAAHVFKKVAEPRMHYLQDQFLFAGQLKDTYKEMGLEYFRNYYAFSVCLTLFTTLLSISVFLVAHRGWANCTVKLKAFLIFNVVFASFYYFIPKVLNNETNISKNMNQHKAYQGIQIDILSFCRTVDTLNRAKMDTMIARTANQIKSNYDFAIGIDPAILGGSPLDKLNSSNGNSKTQ